MALDADVGWAGFTFEAVARTSGVGKASLYRRWPRRGDLLRQTFEARWLRVGSLDQGDIRTIFWPWPGSSPAPRRVPMPARTSAFLSDIAEHPEVLEFLRPYAEVTVAEGRAIVRRAVGRRQLPASTNPGLVMDLVVGAISNDVRMTPARLRSRMLRQLDNFLVELVEIVLAGVEKLVALWLCQRAR